MTEAAREMYQASRDEAREGKYLTFRLAAEEYGVDILKVQEIIGMMDITQVPRAPSTVRGVINLRGKVIPIVDLRVKFAMERAEVMDKTCIIVVQMRVVRGTQIMGFIVDEVCDVQDILAEEIEEPPCFGIGIDTAYILGMAKAKGTVKILVDIGKVLASDELENMAQRVRQETPKSNTIESETDINREMQS